MAIDKMCECVIEMALPSGGFAPRIVRCRFCKARLKFADTILAGMGPDDPVVQTVMLLIRARADYDKEIGDGKTQGG